MPSVRCCQAGYRRTGIAASAIPARANLQRATAACLRDPDGNGSTAYGIMVLTADGDHITEITGFADPALFPAFGLPARMEG